jgi:hypothetical protein
MQIMEALERPATAQGDKIAPTIATRGVLPDDRNPVAGVELRQIIARAAFRLPVNEALRQSPIHFHTPTTPLPPPKCRSMVQAQFCGDGLQKGVPPLQPTSNFLKTCFEVVGKLGQCRSSGSGAASRNYSCLWSFLASTHVNVKQIFKRTGRSLQQEGSTAKPV